MAVDTLEPIFDIEVQFFVFKSDMVTIFVEISLAISKVYNKYFILLFSKADDKIIRLDIVIDKSFGMDPLDTV